MSVNAIRTKLLSKLQAMTTLKASYDWETSNSEGNYPYATITLNGGESEFASTAHNLRRRQFKIRVYQERSRIGQGPESAEDITSSVIDELEIAFDMDTTLSGTCKYVHPLTWDARYQDRELDVRILQIDIEAIELVTSQ
jgi:hypothetical protein